MKFGMVSLYDPIDCGKKLEELWNFFDALRVQTEYSPTNY